MRAAERRRKANRMLVIDKKATGRKITEQMERSGNDDVIADKSKQ